MAKNTIDKEMIIQCGIRMTEESGVEQLSMAKISKELKVSTPALYRHVESLPELKTIIANRTLERVKNEIIRSVMGKSGIDALRMIGRTYIVFAREHPELYETIQWMNLLADEPQGSIFYEVIQLVYDFAAEYEVSELEAFHIIRTVRAIAQGYADIEAHKGFSHPSAVEDSIDYAFDTFILGIETRISRK